MARKKAAADAASSEETDSKIDQIYAEIEKGFGANILIGGDQAITEEQQIIPISPSLDIITSGGILEGSWVGVTGPPKTGKTSLCLCFAANAQRSEYGSRRIFYSKIEGRLSLHHLKAIEGLNLERGAFNIIQSTPDKILSAQDNLKIISQIARTIPRAVIIIDSISSLCDEKELTEGVGTETRGGGAKLFSQFCRNLNQVIPVQKTIVLGITHIIANTSGFGAPTTERAANMWRYQRDYHLHAKYKKIWEVDGKPIGIQTNWLCETSALGPPGLGIDSFLRFGIGIDHLYELVNYGVVLKLIKQSGSWYSLTFVEDEQKAQGLENIYELLKNSPEWAEQLHKEVLKVMVG